MDDGSAVSIGGDVSDSTVISGNGNVVIQIYDQVYRRDELKGLISGAFNLDEFLQFWREAFLAQEFPLAEKVSFNNLIDDFILKNDISRLLSEVKKRNVTAYRRFISTQILDTIGLSKDLIPEISMGAGAIQNEIERTNQTVRLDGLEDENIEFENQDRFFDQIRQHESSHIVLYAPSGVGKTYFLQHFRTRFPDTRCVYIDLKRFRVSNILREAVRQLRDDDRIDNTAGYQDLAMAINAIHQNDPHITRFFFLFDSVDDNPDAVEFLFSLDNLIDEREFRRRLEGWQIARRIDLKIVMAARNEVKPREIYRPFQKSTQIKYESFGRSSIQKMLENLATKRNTPVFPEVSKSISANVFYLTGGHPKCVKQMLFDLADMGFILPTQDEWSQLYQRCVKPIIHEMLGGIDMETLIYIWNLCIFRRLDQRLLGGLLDRGILPMPAGEKSRQARDLRPRLDRTHLFDSDDSTVTMTMNYALRHVLALNMQYDSPDRYEALHALALEMLFDRLQSSEAGQHKAVERTVMHLCEIIYHSAKILEVKMPENNRQSQSAEICERLKSAFDKYLSLAFTLVRESDHADFFLLLKRKWESDDELRETIHRATGDGDCHHALKQLVEKFAETNK